MCFTYKMHRQERQFFTRPFEFLSLGIMAYVGGDKALTQVELGEEASVSVKVGACSV